MIGGQRFAQDLCLRAVFLAGQASKARGLLLIEGRDYFLSPGAEHGRHGSRESGLRSAQVSDQPAGLWQAQLGDQLCEHVISGLGRVVVAHDPEAVIEVIFNPERAVRARV